MKKEIGFTMEELDLIKRVIGETSKLHGSRKHTLCNDILSKIKEGRGWADLHLSDMESGKRYSLDFVWFAFPGLKSEGYRIEGFHQTGKAKAGYSVGEMHEFGSLVLVDSQAKIINW